MSSRSSRKARGPEYAAEVRKSAAEMLNRAMQVALYGSPREQKLHEERKKRLQEEKKRWEELRGELLKRSQQESMKNGLYLFIYIYFSFCSINSVPSEMHREFDFERAFLSQ